MTSVSSKFWWSQPINRGRKGGGWEATAAPAKTQAQVFVFGARIRLHAAARLALCCCHSNGECGLQATWTPVRIIWFFSFDQRSRPSLAAEIRLQCTLSESGVYFCLFEATDGAAAVCQFSWCTHVSQRRQTLQQNRDLSPKHYCSKLTSFLLQRGVH